MARYSVTNAKAGVNTANTIMWQLRSSASQRIRLLELGLSVEVAPTSGPAFRINRPTAVGTSSATATPQAEDSSVVAASSILDTAWSANPTLAANDLRRYAVTNAIGAGVVWTWYDSPLIIPVSAGLCIVNANAAGTTLGTLSMYALIEE